MKKIFLIAVISVLFIDNFIESSSSDEESFETDPFTSYLREQARYQINCYLRKGPCNLRDMIFREVLPYFIIHGCELCFPRSELPATFVGAYEILLPEEWKQVTEKYGPPIVIAVND